MSITGKLCPSEVDCGETRPNPTLLSLILPLYNEEEVMPLLEERINAFVQTCDFPTEIVLVNDGSSDQTQSRIQKWCERDSHVKAVLLARNFGHQVAVTAGLEHSSGDAVVVMDGDLQDPPELVHRMIEQYRRGYDVVYARRTQRNGETVFKRTTAYLFYRLMRTLVHKDLPADAGDFRLMSRAVVDALLRMPERHRFLRGMIAWLGFRQTAVEFARSARSAGHTKYNLPKMLGLAWNASVSFSPLPLRINTALGVLIASFGALYGIYSVFHALVVRDTVPGWTTLVVLFCLIGGWILISVGILGEYVAKIFEEVKNRPLYVVEKTLNFSSLHARSDTQQRNNISRQLGRVG